MRTVETVRTLSRGALGLSLRASRLPLTNYETVLRRGRDNTEWPPAVTYEGLEATIKQFFGSLTRDEQLVEQGRVQSAKVSQLKKAAELEAIADQERRAAQQQLDEDRQRLEKERTQVKQQAAQRE